MDATDSVAASRQGTVSMSHLVRILVRRWRVVAACAVLLCLAALAYFRLVPGTYTASSAVVVRPVVMSPFSATVGSDRAVNMTAENGLATSGDVIAGIASATGSSAADARAALRVEVPVGGQVLRFRYSAGTAEQAATGADAAAESYLAVRRSGYERQRDAMLRSYDTTIATITDQRTTIEKKLPSGPSPYANSVLAQLQAVNEQLSRLGQERAAIAAVDLTPGTVSLRATGPVPSNRDSLVAYLIAALLGGALLGALGAYLREATDRRVRWVEQAAALTGVPALGFVRRMRRAGSVTAADVRYAALAILDRAARAPGVPVVLLSTRTGTGRSSLAAGLAVALADAGHNVYLGAPPERMERLRELLRSGQREPGRAVVDSGPPGADTARTGLGSARAGVEAPAGTRPFRPGAVPVRGVEPAPPVSEPAPDGPAGGGPAGAVGYPVAAVPAQRAGAAGSGPPGTVPGGPDGSTVAAVAGDGAGPGDTPAAVAARPGAVAPVITGPDGTVGPAGSAGPAGIGTTGTVGPDGTGTAPVRVGVVDLGPLDIAGPDGPGGADVILLDAPPAELDERGVRAARDGVAVFVIARDGTRVDELARLVDRMQAAGATAMGFILTGSGRG